MDILISPVHLRDVNESFNTLFDLCETAVIGQVSHFGYDATALWITICNLHPRIFAQLLKTQRYAVAFAIKLKNLHIKLLSHFNHFTWVLDSLPCHVSDVQQSIDAAEIKKWLDRDGLDLIVEKIEDEKQLVELLDFGIDFGQGYLFGEPRLSRSD